jgi:hypothetical protein
MSHLVREMAHLFSQNSQIQALLLTSAGMLLAQ